MKKKVLIALVVLAAIIFVIYPNITIQKEDKIIAFRYSDDTSQFETEVSADENYVYWAERDVTWSGFDVKKFGPFHVIYLETEPGNTIASKYTLEYGYMDYFLANAVIEVVEKDYKEIEFTKDDIAALIAGRTPVEGGQRYVCPDYDAATKVYYRVGGEECFMSIFEVDGLLVVQVGYSDESPKFIAYE